MFRFELWNRFSLKRDGSGSVRNDPGSQYKGYGSGRNGFEVSGLVTV